MANTGIGRTEARRQMDALLRRLAGMPADAQAAIDAANWALDHGLEEEAAPALARAASRSRGDFRLWQMLGLLYRGADLHDPAIAGFERAARLNPADPRIAYGHALTALEGGLPATDLFAEALRLAPDDGDISLGYVAALKAQGRAQAGSDWLEERLRKLPFWIAGHQTFARLNAMQKTGRELASIEAALTGHPRAIPLHALRTELLARLVSPEQRLVAAQQARKHLGDDPLLLIQEAVSASEAGHLARADSLFLAIGKNDDVHIALAILRHLVRAERFAEADGLAGRLSATSEGVSAWAYRHTAWRALGDPRLEWLEQGGDLVRRVDISADLPPLGQLAATLRAVHNDIGQPLDQSVHGGTQTDGPLFKRINGEVRALRRAAVKAVEAYTEALPPIDPRHPLLSAPRQGAVRFAGSWSVRLMGAAGGHHTNHIHGLGWLSSALHISLPPAPDKQAGCLTFGAPPAQLGLRIDPSATVRPLAGHLVLFPSYLWHGVTPFADGERLTVAFDVARPRA